MSPLIKLRNNNNVRFLLLCLLNFSIIAVAYSVYIINFHFSEDSFEAIASTQAIASTNLRNGRFIHYFLYSASDLLGLNIIPHFKVTQLLLTAANAWGTALLCSSFARILFDKPLEKKLETLALDCGFLLLIINPGYLSGWYYWPETCFGATFSTLAAFAAIRFWCSDKSLAHRLSLSFPMLFISICMYQVYIEYYVGICIAYTLASNRFRFSKHVIINFIALLACAAIAGVLNIIIMSQLQNAGAIIRDERSATLSIEAICNNIQAIADEQTAIWVSMYGLLPRFYMVGSFAGFIALSIIGLVAKRSYPRPSDLATLIAAGALILIASFSPNVISGLTWLAPRTYVGIFCLYPLLISATIVCLESTSITLARAHAALSALTIIIMTCCLLAIEANTITSNGLDLHELQLISSEIKQHEEKTGTQIEKIHFGYDSSPMGHYPVVSYAVYELNSRSFIYPWWFEYAIQSNFENAEISEMSTSEQERAFKDKDWEYFEPREQIVCSGSTAYVLIY